MIFPKRQCVRAGCNEIITDAKRENRMFCSSYCLKKSWDDKNRPSKKLKELV